MNDGYQLAELRGRNKYSKRLGKGQVIVFTVQKYDGIDFFSTGNTLSNSGITYVGEIKNYDDPNNPRPFKKYKNYMIDWSKLANLRAEALRRNSIPLLVVFFEDYTIVWDITNIDIDSRRKWEWVNKDGQNYGKKEYQLMTYLYEKEILWKEDKQATEQKMKLLS